MNPVTFSSFSRPRFSSNISSPVIHPDLKAAFDAFQERSKIAPNMVADNLLGTAQKNNKDFLLAMVNRGIPQMLLRRIAEFPAVAQGDKPQVTSLPWVAFPLAPSPGKRVELSGVLRQLIPEKGKTDLAEYDGAIQMDFGPTDAPVGTLRRNRMGVREKLGDWGVTSLGYECVLPDYGVSLDGALKARVAFEHQAHFPEEPDKMFRPLSLRKTPIIMGSKTLTRISPTDGKPGIGLMWVNPNTNNISLATAKVIELPVKRGKVSRSRVLYEGPMYASPVTGKK